ncbi:MAG: hypothetical protein A3F72_09090 [Bacteroidetes bacterium RIFCSPLOWO2_12_FULL_35_15]|nr:MAG: hypothetical protein A3F72_09090 [Bacteroidetes bacterium RIFCSPLOWO2_12_FULL_35_15]
MKGLIKDYTDKYPEIIIDKSTGIFEIKGVSLPEDGKEFYQNVLDLLDDYVRAPHHTTHFTFNMRYFNISSSKMFLFMFYKLLEIPKTGNSVTVTWYYEDDDILEAGHDYAHMIDLPFQFKCVEEECLVF